MGFFSGGHPAANAKCVAYAVEAEQTSEVRSPPNYEPRTPNIRIQHHLRSALPAMSVVESGRRVLISAPSRKFCSTSQIAPFRHCFWWIKKKTAARRQKCAIFFALWLF